MMARRRGEEKFYMSGRATLCCNQWKGEERKANLGKEKKIKGKTRRARERMGGYFSLYEIARRMKGGRGKRDGGSG